MDLGEANIQSVAEGLGSKFMISSVVIYVSKYRAPRERTLLKYCLVHGRQGGRGSLESRQIH